MAVRCTVDYRFASFNVIHVDLGTFILSTESYRYIGVQISFTAKLTLRNRRKTELDVIRTQKYIRTVYLQEESEFFTYETVLKHVKFVYIFYIL